MKAKTEKDDKEGYVTLAGNQGTVYLMPYSAFMVALNKLDKALQEMGDATKGATEYIEQKGRRTQSHSVRTTGGNKAWMMKPRVSKVGHALSDLRK
jgi:hypothetical protein